MLFIDIKYTVNFFMRKYKMLKKLKELIFGTPVVATPAPEAPYKVEAPVVETPAAVYISPAKPARKPRTPKAEKAPKVEKAPAPKAAKVSAAPKAAKAPAAPKAKKSK
jgi:hypothetical protein